MILRFSFASLDTARLVRKKLDRITSLVDDEGFGGIIAEFKPTRELIDEIKIKRIASKLFVARFIFPVSMMCLDEGVSRGHENL